jgi:glycosyltransferase involved in cell wall biosynthesis
MEYLHQAIAGIVSQTHRRWELHIGVNGFADGSDAVRLAKSLCPQANVVDLGMPGSAARALNELLKIAQGDVVCVCDADDVWEPTKLEKQIAVIGKYDVVGTGAVYIGERTDPLDIRIGDVTLMDLIETNHVVHSSVMARRGMLSYTEDRELAGIFDYECFLRLASEGKSIRNLRDRLVRIRVHPKSAHGNRAWPEDAIRRRYA